MEKMKHLGFPVPLLGMKPVRLPLLFDDGEILVLSKPVNVLVQADPWYPQLPVLIEAIRHQSQACKPEFQNLEIPAEGLWAVTDLDAECHGPVVFARNRSVAEDLRSSLGSGDFTFRYKFVSRNSNEEAALECDLPLARHRHEKKMLISHTTGKKTVTRMKRVEKIGSLEIWSAETNYPRRHQILIHPLEKGLRVIGDMRYAREKPLLLSRFKRNYHQKRDIDERPLYEGAAYFLEQIILPDRTIITNPEPARWKGMIRQLSQY